MNPATPTQPAARASKARSPSGRDSATPVAPGTTPCPAVAGWKRCLDLCGVALSLPLVLPLLALTALWIRLVAGGPTLLRQSRIGRHGRPFALYKFRSMIVNADLERQASYVRQLVDADQPLIKLDLLGDPRLIAGGCLLRAAGLDELPQLWNVLRGDMSLVGPRPCLPAEYGLFSPRHRERFAVLPGLTGIWQVNGKNQASFSEMNAMDIDYVRHASLRTDLYLIMRTPAALWCQLLLAFRTRRAAGRSRAHRGPARGSARGGPPHRHRQLP
ncbi:MAG: sugar transferase [Verrucomicrobiota bacterium]